MQVKNKCTDIVTVFISFIPDTEDASETDMATLEEEISEMKEQ